MSTESASPRKLSKQEGSDIALDAREDMALAIAQLFTVTQHLYSALGGVGQLYGAISGEPAPEVQVTPIVRQRERVA
jgi:hypothetical protein